LHSPTGNEKHPAVGSSGGYWSLGESLNLGFVEMKDCNDREGHGGRKVCAPIYTKCYYVGRESRANNVPAAAVIR